MLIRNQILKIFFPCIIFLFVISCSKDVSSEGEPAVHILKDKGQYQLIRNGEPFYIKGAAGNGQYLEELKEAGGNTIRVYDTIGLRQVLNNAQRLGLAVVVDIPLPIYYNGFDYNQEYTDAVGQKIAATVRRFKDHPALLYWNLGNELEYPPFYKITNFFSYFEDLVEIVKQADPNHPISTAIIAGSRKRIISYVIRNPGLDFYSLNSFGSLTNLQEPLESISFLMNSPYVISEWGVNGPWEEDELYWKAPIEPTFAKKAEIIRERFYSEVLQDPKCLGSFYFFWGQKHERTSTWFSVFSKEGEKSNVFYELNNLWNDETNNFPGPDISYALLNGKGAPSEIILNPSQKANMTITFNQKDEEEWEFEWVVKREAWADDEKELAALPNLFQSKSAFEAVFTAPNQEGPYRVYYTVRDNKGNFSSVNIPFYVLNAGNDK